MEWQACDGFISSFPGCDGLGSCWGAWGARLQCRKSGEKSLSFSQEFQKQWVGIAAQCGHSEEILIYLE